MPYDPAASLSAQVAQSMASSLEHLGTDFVDSFVLHGPSSNYDWTDDDAEVWEAMRQERDAGHTRRLGVSNVSLGHLEQMLAVHGETPAFVQNRCFARMGWDRDVRLFCHEREIIYQGFSLLTANAEVLRHPFITDIARRMNASPAQTVFAFARDRDAAADGAHQMRMHMKQDLASREIVLSPDEVRGIESVAG